jgi:uncharacterized membrane protein YphA (DoxX/SURF4 family)/uncharacterized membrane protein
MGRTKQEGIPVGFSLAVTPAALALVAIPMEVTWSYAVAALVFATGLVVIVLRGEWRREPKLDKLILFGPLFYAVPIAAFGTEHFTLNKGIASIVPAWIPWHVFWVYLVGACLIAAAFSLVTGIGVRLSASLLALMFFLFVVLMDVPGCLRNPHNRFAIILALRELSFGAGPLALAASLSLQQNPRAARLAAIIARYLIAVPVLYYAFEQFLHADHVPGIPLEMLMPAWLFGHSFWTYLAAVVYTISGIFLVAGKRTRIAAASIGLTVLLLILVVYVPIAIAERSSLEGLNYLFDTLMYCGTLLLLARAMPRPEPST